MKRFKGKRIFIAGAGSGFGRRTAEKFSEEGAVDIYLVDIVKERLDITVEEIKKRGAHPIPLCFDLGDPNQCSEAIAKAISKGPLDVLICNAAVVDEKQFIKIDEFWTRIEK